MTNKYTVADVCLDITPLDKSLPNLTIGVKDGNMLYTRPEQIINRKRCKCFERRTSRYYEAAVILLKSTLHSIMPATKVRVSARVKQASFAFKGKVDSFFVEAPTL